MTCDLLLIFTSHKFNIENNFKVLRTKKSQLGIPS